MFLMICILIVLSRISTAIFINYTFNKINVKQIIVECNLTLLNDSLHDHFN